MEAKQRIEQASGLCCSSSPPDTPRLLLRQFVPSDLDHFARICSDPEVMAHQHGVVERAKASRLLGEVIDHYSIHTFGLWALIHKTDKRLIGFCGLIMQDIDSEDEIVLECRLLPKYWGQGLAGEAAGAVYRYSQNELGVLRIVSLIDPGNRRAIRIAEKLGASFERYAHCNGQSFLLYVYPSLKTSLKD